MKKRVLAGILMMVFVLASAMTVSAADSKGNGSKSAGVTVVSDKSKFEASATINSDVLDATKKAAIEAYNANPSDTTEAKMFEGSADALKAVKDKTPVTTVFEIDEIAGANATLPADITIEVDALGDKATDVKIAVYTKEGWKIITPAKVSGKQITANFSAIGPMIVYATTASGSATGTSPSTVGTSSAWMIMAAVALIAAGACVVVSQKKSR